MATTDVISSISGPLLQDADIIEMREIHIYSAEAPEVPNDILNGGSTQTRESISCYRKKCVALHNAAFKGDWRTAKHLLGPDPRPMCASITKGGQNILHIATVARQTNFIEESVKLMTEEDLTSPDKNGNTAFCFAAAAGVIPIAKIMLGRNPELMKIRGGQNMIPLYFAAQFARKDMASYLYGKRETKEILSEDDQKIIFFTCIRTGLYDLALKLLMDNRKLAVTRDMNHDTALHVLSRIPSAFANGNPGLLKRLINSFPGMRFMAQNMDSMSTQALELVRCLWEEISKEDDLELTNLIGKPSHLLFDAAKLGNFEFLAQLIGSYPDLVYELDNNNHSIFHIAVMNRHANIFNLIYETAFTEELMVTFEDKDQNNILHLAAKYPQSSQVSKESAGAALQMQRELLWFEQIRKKVQPSYREKKNSKGQTPQEIFSKEHKGLLKSGELWMKQTANSCMIVATLIATIMFAAAITVPGGNNNDTGVPIHQRKKLFQVFVLSDAIALSSSSVSILIFLSILVSRYAENDFRKSLPRRLMIGLSTLFISIITMMVAFSCTFFLAYHDKLNWATMLTAVLASLSVPLFALLQYPLLRDIYCSTYHSRYLFKPIKHMVS